jgi:hypothetical protein
VSAKFVQIKGIGSKLAPPRRVIDFPYNYVYGKNLKIFLKTSARAEILSMKHFLTGVYHVCSNKSPGVNIGPASVVINFPYMYTFFFCHLLMERIHTWTKQQVWLDRPII